MKRKRQIVARFPADPGWHAVVADGEPIATPDLLDAIISEALPRGTKRVMLHAIPIDAWGLLEPICGASSLLSSMGLGGHEAVFAPMSEGKPIEMALGVFGPDMTLEQWVAREGAEPFGAVRPG